MSTEKIDMANKLEKYYATNTAYYELLNNQDTYDYGKFLDFLKNSDGKNILEFGCGTGYIVDKLVDYDFNAIGIDISPIAIEMAKRNKKGKFILLQKKLPFDDNYFDTVGTFNVLEHLYEPEYWLKEMIRVLKPGGNIIIACPNFLRIFGIRGNHWYINGYYSKLRNSYSILKKFIYSKFFPHNMKFDFVQPQIYEKNFQPDDDAICMTNSIDISFILRKYGVNKVYHSSLNTPIKSKYAHIIEKISELPIIRTTTGGIFIVGIKNIKRY